MPLEIPESVCQKLIAHCRTCLPNEGCGILAGKGEQVSVFYPVTNAEPSPCGFFMDPEELFRVMRSMREAGLTMLGICHSHPDSPAYPSEKDIRLAYYEDAVHLIVSFSDQHPAVAAFRIAAGEVSPVDLRRS